MERNKCRHFTSFQEESCLAKIRYSDMLNTRGELPCFSWHLFPVYCPYKSYYTAKDLEELKEEQVNDFLNKIKVARESIVNATKGQPQMIGQIPCPICTTGTLKYLVGHNNNIHATCTTKGCVVWVE